MALLSMTGYGEAEDLTPSGEYRVVIRSVNNRFLDIQYRTPRTFNSIEAQIGKLLSSKISRGSVVFSIAVLNRDENDVALTVDEKLLGSYIDAIRSASGKFSLSGDVSVSDILSMKDNIFRNESVKFREDELLKHLKPIISEALERFLDSRAKEGEFLKKELIKIIDSLEKSVAKVEKRSPIRLKKQIAEFKKKIKLFAEDVADPTRIAMETAVMADKLDLAEECVRLRAHIKSMKDNLESKKPVGKRLGFILQEMNREANTIGSKANDIKISEYSVSMKESIEKIREQTLNIE